MRSNWGRVFYTNLWASALLAIMTAATEPHVLKSMRWTHKPVTALAVSCAAGVAMSYFAFLCRAAISATSFTVVGNVCKILTVLINISIWDKHASPLGLGALLVCLAAAALYQQSPLRSDAAVAARVESLKGNGSRTRRASSPHPRLNRRASCSRAARALSRGQATSPAMRRSRAIVASRSWRRRSAPPRRRQRRRQRRAPRNDNERMSARSWTLGRPPLGCYLHLGVS